ncbi:hypothetical protein H696_05851 [Fonticula alba]|uniref:Lysosomal dipeptide transporter MFSD1 n=1 Tax=Fonticula alba TaxID=691883 RepID=A0A058Z2I2_FONAL|nr:hypothetical protein H696_05851 [Fonticula alba]KCV67742.1 hypothetical protein H696_05851 [Fonticula alba]|eukprot:XP_009497926.1 hypothetical protein H696_05851 [Fonticula alba]
MDAESKPLLGVSHDGPTDLGTATGLPAYAAMGSGQIQHLTPANAGGLGASEGPYPGSPGAGSSRGNSSNTDLGHTYPYSDGDSDGDGDDDDGGHLSGAKATPCATMSERDAAGKTLGNTLVDKPLKYRLLALVCSCLLSVGSHYASHMLSALKPTLKEELDITNAQFGLLQSAVSLVNTVIPLFGGIFIDLFGTTWGSLAASTLILVGEAIVALSTMAVSFEVMVIGRVIYGIGAGYIVTVQEAILAHWFEGRGLALTIGLQIAMSRLSSFLATGTVVPISESTGFYGNAFWVSTGICLFSWLVNIAYIVLMKYVHRLDTDKEKELQERLRKKNTFQARDMLAFPPIFWFVIFLAIALGASWNPFMHISAELVQQRWGKSDSIAAWESSIQLAIPVVLSPVLGYMVDHFGRRSLIAIISAVVLLIGYSLVGFTCISPLVGLVLFSFSLSLGPVAMITAIPLVLDLRLIGTALGLYKCAINIGSTLLDPIVGVIQDTHGGTYHLVMVVFCCIAVVATIISVLLLLTSHLKYGGLIDLPRAVLESTGALSMKSFPSMPLLSKVCIGVVCVFLAGSWMVYFFVTLNELLADGSGSISASASSLSSPLADLLAFSVGTPDSYYCVASPVAP